MSTSFLDNKKLCETNHMAVFPRVLSQITSPLDFRKCFVTYSYAIKMLKPVSHLCKNHQHTNFYASITKRNFFPFLHQWLLHQCEPGSHQTSPYAVCMPCFPMLTVFKLLLLVNTLNIKNVCKEKKISTYFDFLLVL